PDMPAGLPDIEPLTRLANELFGARPDGSVPTPHVPGGLPAAQPSSAAPDRFAVPPGTFPGGGSSPGAPPSPTTIQPSASDVPSSADDTPMGPAVVPPTSALSVPPLSGVLPVVGTLPSVARPVLNPGVPYY